MAKLSHESVLACRSILLRILNYAADEGAIDANPARKVPPPKRRADPEKVLGQPRRRALTREEAGRLLACFPLSWWDHVTTLLGTGLRFGEPAGLRRRRVHLDRLVPVLQVVEVRYQAGKRFGSGFKPRPKSDAGIREIPLAPPVVEAIRRQLPPGSDPAALVFTGPGGGNSVQIGARTVLSRDNFRRTYQAALAKLSDTTAVGLRPTAIRVLQLLRTGGPRTVDQLTVQLGEHGRRAVRQATVAVALRDLQSAGLVAADRDGQLDRWSALPPARDPMLDALEFHGAHDLRHTFSTWLEDAGIPARVIDELMGHEPSRRGDLAGSRIGARYRHTTPEMAARIIAAIEARLAIVLQTAEHIIENHPSRSALRVF